MRLRQERPGAFSLIEILVAVAIMTIIIGISLASSQGSRRVARDSQRKMELEQIRSALETYRIDTGDYPGSLEVLTQGESAYLNEDVITDPAPSTHKYVYLPGTGVYELCAYLETADSSNKCGDCLIGGGSNCNYVVTQP